MFIIWYDPSSWKSQRGFSQQETSLLIFPRLLILVLVQSKCLTSDVIPGLVALPPASPAPPLRTRCTLLQRCDLLTFSHEVHLKSNQPTCHRHANHSTPDSSGHHWDDDFEWVEWFDQYLYLLKQNTAQHSRMLSHVTCLCFTNTITLCVCRLLCQSCHLNSPSDYITGLKGWILVQFQFVFIVKLK